MSHVLHVSDEQYEILARAAEAQGTTLESFLAHWIEELRDRKAEPRYLETDEWFRHLGVSDAVIEEIKREVKEEAETDADA